MLSYMFRECDIEVVVYHDLADAVGAPDATLGACHFSVEQPDFHLASTTLPEGFLQPLDPVLFIPETVWKDVAGN